MSDNLQTTLFETAFKEVKTPMMQQYLAIKANHQDCLLFYRLGDFYELFYDDAISAAKILNIVLTARGKGTDSEIPMCGVPAHAYEHYLEKLIKAGCKVAVCEQLESPEEAKKRGYKAVVRREVVRIITQGTLIEESLADSSNINNVVSISLYENCLAVAAADVATGHFIFMKSQKSELFNDIAKFSPKEIIISDSLAMDEELKDKFQSIKSILTIRANVLFDYKRVSQKILSYFKIQNLESIKTNDKFEVVAIGSIIEYLEHTHKSNLPRLDLPKNLNSSHYMQIDASTWRNLEIEASVSGDKHYSLINVLNNTETAAGARLLKHFIRFPLINPAAIEKRQEGVQFFIDNAKITTDLRTQLKALGDMERVVNRVYTRTASPRDLGMLKISLNASLFITTLFHNHSLPSIINANLMQIGSYGELLEKLELALAENLPLKISDGGFLKSGYNSALDKLYNLKINAADQIHELQEKYRKASGVNTLKIVRNNVLGYFIEVSISNAPKIDTQIFKHRQTLGSSSRYVTPELAELEVALNECDKNIAEIEREEFDLLLQLVQNSAEYINATAGALSYLDVLSTFAQNASLHKYVRPHVNDSRNLIIQHGRHPVLDVSLGKKFVPNSISQSSDNYLWLLTGPNMAGKSTFLRQSALIIIMAQIGSFVPAESAVIGIVDKLFSRIGASDDISSGNSTFMVEMIETANILNNATNKSFVILDEVGRGTATNDGLSIAWAITEKIHNDIKARTLFATHYHELATLEEDLAGLSNYTLRVKEWDGKIIFMHEITKGRADKSYGIHVAELAGVPNDVIVRANAILTNIEEKRSISVDTNLQQTSQIDEIGLEIKDKVSSINLDNLTPKAAYDLLYELKSKVA